MDTQSRIQAYLRVAASHGRDTERIGPFLTTFTPHNDNPYLNYAIPDDNATPTPGTPSSSALWPGETWVRRLRLRRRWS